MRLSQCTAITVAIACHCTAFAGDVGIQGGNPVGNHIRCTGMLSITADTPASSQIGSTVIVGVENSLGCTSYCGDGVVNGMEQCDPAANITGCTSNCTWIRFSEYGGTSPYIDSDTDMLLCRQRSPPVSDTPSGRDVTFLAFGDSQYGNNNPVGTPPVHGPGVQKNRLDMNLKNIKALNRAEELTWPSGFVSAGQNISRVRGVVIAGDITQEADGCTTDLGTGSNCGWIRNAYERSLWYQSVPEDHAFTEWAQFRDEYGLCGDKEMIHPAYEGAGNHDYFRDVGEEYEHPVHKYIAYRNNFRWGVDRVDPMGKGHYSWTWDDVHFVQLNLAATDNTIINESWLDGASPPELLFRISMKPYSALSFLKRDLELHAVPGQPVVLISHYPWAESGRFPAKDRLALFQVIKDYNVVALVHGHNHSSAFRTWSPCDDVSGDCATALGVNTPPKPYAVIDAGNPFYGNGSNRVWARDGTKRRYNHYSVIRITDSYLEVASVSARADVSACDHGSPASCDFDGDCAWNSTYRKCSPTTEMCLPGVATLFCIPAADPDDPPIAPEDGCNESLTSGGWSARVRLSDRLVVSQTQRNLHQYCP